MLVMYRVGSSTKHSTPDAVRVVRVGQVRDGHAAGGDHDARDAHRVLEEHHVHARVRAGEHCARSETYMYVRGVQCVYD